MANFLAALRPSRHVSVTCTGRSGGARSGNPYRSVWPWTMTNFSGGEGLGNTVCGKMAVGYVLLEMPGFKDEWHLWRGACEGDRGGGRARPLHPL